MTIKSPCVRNCCLNGDDICLGCFRTLAEILKWSDATDDENAQVLQNAGKRKAGHQKKYKS